MHFEHTPYKYVYIKLLPEGYIAHWEGTWRQPQPFQAQSERFKVSLFIRFLTYAQLYERKHIAFSRYIIIDLIGTKIFNIFAICV